MGRPKRHQGQTRSNRLTAYLTEEECQRLRALAAREGRAINQLVLLAIKDRAQRMLNLSAEDNPATFEEVMSEEDDFLRGFACENGHLFWIEWLDTHHTVYCPICGSTMNHQRTWDGMMNRK